jgi:hypothetical protein
MALLLLGTLEVPAPAHGGTIVMLDSLTDSVVTSRTAFSDAYALVADVRKVRHTLPDEPNPAPVSGSATDTVTAPTRCSVKQPPALAGVVMGRVVNAEKLGLAGAAVVAEWLEEIPAKDGSEPPRQTLYQLTALSVLDGAYAFCGIPLDHVVALRATLSNRRSPAPRIQIIKPARRAELDLEMGAAPSPP